MDDDFDKSFDEFSGKTPPEAESKDDQGQEVHDEVEATQKPTVDRDDVDPKDQGDQEDPKDQEDDQSQDEQPQEGDEPAEKPVDAELEALRRQNAELLQFKRSNEGRIAAYQRRLEELTNPGKKVSKKAESEELKKLREEYPEIAAPLEAAFETQRQELEQLRSSVSHLSEERQTRFLAEQEQALNQAHPDWRDITGKSEFRQWAGSQPAFVQDALMRNASEIVNAAEASYIVDLYKKSLSQQPPSTDGASKTNERRRRQLDSAAAVSSKGPGTPATAPDDFDAAFDYFARR